MRRRELALTSVMLGLVHRLREIKDNQRESPRAPPAGTVMRGKGNEMPTYNFTLTGSGFEYINTGNNGTDDTVNVTFEETANGYDF